MASYYPEGECFFKRSSLVYADEWKAENEDQFYKHVLVEYQWNGWVTSGPPGEIDPMFGTITPAKDLAADFQHSRSKLVSGQAAFGTYDTVFGVWDKLYVGESAVRDPERMHAVTALLNSQNFNECRDRATGGPRKYILRPVPIRHKDTKWLWIDGTIPLRAVYFPVAHKSEKAFQDYCTYVVIDFRARQSVSISNLAGEFESYSLTRDSGLGLDKDITWGFNVADIITYLSLPRQVRNPEYGLFRTAEPGDELVVRASAGKNWHSPAWAINLGQKGLVEHFYREMDLAKIISASFGIDVGWRPYKYSPFVFDLVRSMVEVGLGFVPTIGPLLAVGFNIAMQVMADPDSFSQANVLNLEQATVAVIVTSAKDAKKFVTPSLLTLGSKKVSIPTSRAKRSASLLADSRKLASDTQNLVSDITPIPNLRAPNIFGEDEDDEEKPTGSPPTEEEREAEREADEALNAKLTQLRRENYGEDPPQSQEWLDRIKE